MRRAKRVAPRRERSDFNRGTWRRSTPIPKENFMRMGKKLEFGFIKSLTGNPLPV